MAWPDCRRPGSRNPCLPFRCGSIELCRLATAVMGASPWPYLPASRMEFDTARQCPNFSGKSHRLLIHPWLQYLLAVRCDWGPSKRMEPSYGFPPQPQPGTSTKQRYCHCRMSGASHRDSSNGQHLQGHQLARKDAAWPWRQRTWQSHPRRRLRSGGWTPALLEEPGSNSAQCRSNCLASILRRAPAGKALAGCAYVPSLEHADN